MKIALFDTQSSLKIPKARVRTLVRSVLRYLDAAPKELSVYFVSTQQICQLHEQFFQDSATTDCISFPVDQEHLGEIFVCPETALCYAKKNGLDPRDEVALYIVHGLLHCLGYDDLEPKQRREMRKMEKRCMAHLKKAKISLQP